MHLNIALPHITSALNNNIEKLHQLKAAEIFSLTIRNCCSFEVIFMQPLVRYLDKAREQQLLG